MGESKRDDSDVEYSEGVMVGPLMREALQKMKEAQDAGARLDIAKNLHSSLVSFYQEELKISEKEAKENATRAILMAVSEPRSGGGRRKSKRKSRKSHKKKRKSKRKTRKSRKFKKTKRRRR